MTPLILSAPAKLNASLRVLQKREDGFHELNTLMVKLPGLADEITFETAESFSFSCDDPTVPADETNLVVRAVRAYEKATAKPVTLRISLRKNIPHGAGLGGGSSDAATTLLGLNQLNDAPLSAEELSTIAAELGSDIPFFLIPGAARCTGRGEILEPVEPLPSVPLLLFKPSFAVSTPDAYQRWEKSARLQGIKYGQQKSPWGPLINDLERPVFEKHRFLGELKYWLLSRQETAAALMSGSGSTVFVILKDPASAEPLTAAARTQLDPNLWAWAGPSE
jgi:4-diphosphocytidyl-2-C-methyl-D-erythritol kinase